MKEIDIQKLIDMNHRLLLLLGFSAGFMMEYKNNPYLDAQKDKYNWFFKSLENVVYLDKPLEPMPS